MNGTLRGCGSELEEEGWGLLSSSLSHLSCLRTLDLSHTSCGDLVSVDETGEDERR